jgi:dTMP kinase
LRQKGVLLSIVGMDGSGKTTVSEFIQDRLRDASIEFIVTKQPIWELKSWDTFQEMLADSCTSLDFSTVGGLIAWGRLNTQIIEVMPALKEGKTVICERYVTDIIAWSKFRGAREEWIEGWIAGLLNEDCSFFCDAGPKLLMERLKERNGKKKIGEETIEDVSRLVELYREIAEKRSACFLDTDRSLNERKINNYLLTFF